MAYYTIMFRIYITILYSQSLAKPPGGFPPILAETTKRGKIVPRNISTSVRDHTCIVCTYSDSIFQYISNQVG